MFPKISKRLPAFFIWSPLLLLFAFPYPVLANTILVTDNDGDYFNPGTLGAAFLVAEDGDIIDCSPIAGQTISITTLRLPAIGYNFASPTSSLTILGAGVIIDGSVMYPALSLAQGSAIITDLTIQNTLSQGGSGGYGFTGGGGGTGGGGALYVHSGTVMTISALALNNNQAIGGTGGAGNATGGSGGGGGGYGGGGGGNAIDTGANTGSGGGGGGNNGGTHGGRDGGVGNPNTFTNFAGAGGGGEIPGVNGAKSGGTNASIPATTGGVAGIGTATTGAGAGGGGGSGGGGHSGSDASSQVGGVGGAGGNGFGLGNSYGAGGGGGGGNGGGAGIGTSGGGGGYTGSGGSGGSLGGGGGASGRTGGNGGFGAGGGGGETGGIVIYDLGGAGGSAAGLPAGGGGGSGLGGAILIQEGALLIIQDGISFSGNSTTAGTGGTAANGGTNGGNGSSLGQDIFIQAGGGLTFQINGTLTIPNPIKGAGSSSGPGVIQSGTGTLSLNGINTYLGNTFIQSGTVNLNGSVTGDLTIESIGTLSGNATVGGSIYNSGTLSPGNSIGTINVTNLIQSATSVYAVEVNSAGESDEIVASGSAQVGGSVVVTPDNTNFTTPLTYTIISSGTGVTGTYSSLTSTVPSLMSLIYNPLSVQLIYLPLDTLGANSLKCNALNAANCFVTLTGSDATIVNNALLAVSVNEFQTIFEQMGPAQLSGPTQIQLLDAILVRSTYSKRLQELVNKDRDPNTVWIDLLGQSQHQNNEECNLGYNDTTVGVTIGADTRIHNFVLGSAISYTDDNFHWNQSAGKANINSFYGGLYGRWSQNAFYINAALLGAYNKYKTTRHINFTTIDRNAHSNHSGNEWLTNFGVGYQISSSSFLWIPYINLDYVKLHEDSYTEAGAQSLDLHVNNKNATLLQEDVGIQISTTLDTYRGVFVPTLKLAYINQTPFSSKNYTANFSNSNCAFTGSGWNYERNLFAPSLSLTYQAVPGMLNASIYYDAKIGDRYWAQDGGFSLSVHF